MRLLLDTHVAVWAVADSDRLPSSIEDIIGDPANDVHVSVVTVWEIAIRHALGKKGAPPFSGRDAIRFFTDLGFGMGAVSADHAAAVERLPLLHADPFDRLLIAQALTEPLSLVTHDAQVAAYGGPVIHW